MLAAVEGGPGDEAGVLALQEERLGLAVLEAEDLAVAADVELTLQVKKNDVSIPVPMNIPASPKIAGPAAILVHVRHPSNSPTSSSNVPAIAAGVKNNPSCPYLARVDPLSGERVVVGPHFVGGRAGTFCWVLGVWRWDRVAGDEEFPGVVISGCVRDE